MSKVLHVAESNIMMSQVSEDAPVLWRSFSITLGYENEGIPSLRWLNY